MNGTNATGATNDTTVLRPPPIDKESANPLFAPSARPPRLVPPSSRRTTASRREKRCHVISGRPSLLVYTRGDFFVPEEIFCWRDGRLSSERYWDSHCDYRPPAARTHNHSSTSHTRRPKPSSNLSTLPITAPSSPSAQSYSSPGLGSAASVSVQRKERERRCHVIDLSDGRWSSRRSGRCRGHRGVYLASSSRCSFQIPNSDRPYHSTSSNLLRVSLRVRTASHTTLRAHIRSIGILPAPLRPTGFPSRSPPSTVGQALRASLLAHCRAA
ncbi:hypothetical protein C8F01DRAFT_637407 [Mycena amicta]|nr:hypothetical protein C8F01DRAFT_637407 [Mycena amicta]